MSINRVTGMATGMDTDATVKKMMAPYQTRLNKLNQNKQLTQWKQDTYRDTISDLSSFKSSYLDFAKPENNMLSSNTYAGFDVETVGTGVRATANVGAVAGNYIVDFTDATTHLATAAGITSSDKITKTAGADAGADTKLSEIGVTVPITITYNNGGTTKSIVIGATTKPTAIDGTTTLSGLAQAINTATSSEVLASFSELTGKFTIKTSNTGENTTLSIAGAGLETSGLRLEVPQADGTYTTNKGKGKDLIIKITPPGGSPTTVKRASNNFTIDNITYNFTSDKDSAGNALKSDISVTSNVQKPYDKIVNFIAKYNETIDKIQKKLEEKSQRKYLPLTDDQKKAMSADDIKAWEVKAKEGLLRNDATLSNMLTSMRTAFYTGVEGAGITLSEIGLSTSVDTTQRGKIFVNEIKLKDALQNRGEQVVSLFSKTSSIDYSRDLKADQRILRDKDQGIFQRISDILEDNVTTKRTTDGKKGMLVEKAGIKGDGTEYSNPLTKDMTYQQKYIDDMIKKMEAMESKYYNQFARLEVAMNKMNSQSSWMSQQMGGGQ